MFYIFPSISNLLIVTLRLFGGQTELAKTKAAWEARVPVKFEGRGSGGEAVQGEGAGSGGQVEVKKGGDKLLPTHTENMAEIEQLVREISRAQRRRKTQNE